MNHLRRQLKNLQNAEHQFTPSRDWVRANKELLMKQIKQQGSDIVVSETFEQRTEGMRKLYHVFVTRRMEQLFKPVFTAVIALLLTSGGWIASAYAEPGDMFWDAKQTFNLVIERGQLVITPDDEKAPLHLQFATKQAKVLEQVVNASTDTQTKSELAKRTVENLEKNLTSANNHLKETSAEKSPNLIKDVSLKTQEISKTLKDSADTVGGTDKNLALNLASSATVATQQSLQMVETAVQKKTDAHQEISEEEKILIKEHIDGVVGEMKVEAQKAQTQAKVLVEEVGKGVVQVSPQVIGPIIPSPSSTPQTMQTGTSALISSSTAQAVNTIGTSSTTTVSSGQLVEQVAKNAEETVRVLNEEGKQVVEEMTNQNVLEAIKKTQELSSVVQGTVNQVTQTVKVLLPDIQNSGIVQPLPVTTTTVK